MSADELVPQEYDDAEPLSEPCLEYQGSRYPEGYGRACLGPVRIDANGKSRGRRQVRVHRWVFAQIIGRALERDEVVRHRCDNPPCFRFSHLRLGTHADNARDMYARGRASDRRGVNQGNSKLTEESVREIRRLRADGWTQRSIAAHVGVTQSCVWMVLAGRSWGHVDG